MIEEIRMENIKGQTATQPLTGKDIFIGKNGSGKTTRVQSLGLAMLGNIPGRGKTPAETIKFATGDEMTVGLKTDNFEFTRSFLRQTKMNSKTGEIKTSTTESLSVSPGKGERTATEKKARVFEEIGNFPVMLDFNEFLTLTDTKRREFIYSLSPINSSSWDRSRLKSYLKDRILSFELQENNIEQYEIAQKIIEDALKEYHETQSIHDGLISMMDWVAKESTYWKRKQADSQGAVRQMADMKNQLAETDRDIAANKKELDELQTNLIEVEKKIAADTEKKRAIDNRLNRIEELKKEIELVEGTEIDTNTEELAKEVAALTASMPLPVDVNSQIQPFNEEIARLTETANEQKGAINGIREQVMNIEANVQTLDGALRQVGEMTGACVISHMITCNKDFTGFDSFVDKKKEQAQAVLDDLQEKLRQANASLEVTNSKIQEAEQSKMNVFSNAQKVQEKREELAQQINVKETEIQKRDSLKERKESKLELLNAELNKLVNEKSEPIGDISIMEKQVIGTRSRIEELKKQVDEKDKSKQTLILMNENTLQNNEAQYKASALKTLNEALGAKGVQGELVKEILEPIRSQIEENLKLMKFDEVPYFQTESDTGKEVFEFGWVNEKGHEVNFDALSTGQQTIFLAAMMMTIIDKAQPKLRVLIMDNLNHLDKNNFQLLINGLDQLTDKVDNIILAGALEYEFSADGWNVEDLSKGAASDANKIA